MTPRFNEDDLNKGTYVPLPKGRYPVKASVPVNEDDKGNELTDRDGNPFYKTALEVIGADHKGEKETWTISENWMRHQVIHFMRAVGMMNGNVVDPFFREVAEDSLSWDMNRLLNNIGGMRLMLVVDEYMRTKGENAGKIARTIDFLPLLDKDKKPVKQPEWKEPTINYTHRTPTPPAGGPPDDVNLDPDLDLEEDENFFTD